MPEPPATAADLIRAARDAGLADGDAFPDAARAATAVAAADRLVEAGALTPFLARHLLAGKRRGFVLGGKYRILDLLGAGGMGQVLLCEHLRLRSLVAVKVLPPDRLGNPAAVERFTREARAAAALRDAHLVRAFDIDSDGEFHYLVMEYVYGVSLQALVAARGPLPAGAVAGYARQVASGLAAVHRAGLVHRDVKPANLVLDRHGTVVLVDMGLARFTDRADDDLTDRFDPDAILGTADYIAPEQADPGAKVDTRADIYSLGFVLYFLLVGRPPFDGATPAQKLLWHRTRTPDLEVAAPATPAGLVAVFRRMTAVDPAERFQTPDELVAALGEFVEGPSAPPDPADLPKLSPLVKRLMAASPDADGPPTTGRLAARPGRRSWGRPLVAAGVATVCVVAAVVAAGWEFARLPSALPVAPRVGGYPDPMTGVSEGPAAAIPPDLAVSRLGQERTVLMLVKSRSQTAEAVFLESDTDRTSPKNFSVKIPASAREKFRAVGVGDPFEFYWGATIQVTGHVVLVREKGAGILVTEPGQIRPFRPEGR